MKITVIGGLGYIGSHLTKMLVDLKHDVTILDICFFGAKHLRDVLDKGNCKLIEGDIRNTVDLSKAIKRSDIVYHLGGIVGDPAASIDPDETWLHNIESSHLISNICNYYKVKRLFFASSCSVYGAAPSDIILNEGSYLNPVSHYARSKIESEKIFTEKLDCCYSALRLATVFGYSSRMRFDLVVNLFVMNALKKKELSVYGGTQYRPFIHCIDVARAFKILIDTPENIINREVFNINSNNVSIRKLGKLVAKMTSDYLKEEVKIDLVTKKEDNRNYKASSEKAEWLLKFKPQYNLKSGIVEMIPKLMDKKFDDFETNRFKYSNYENLKRKNGIK